MNTKSNKPKDLTLASNILAGIDKHFSTVTTLTVGGVSYTPTTFKAVFQAYIDAASATAASKGQWSQCVATEHEASAIMNGARVGLRSCLLTLFGAKAVGIFADFGLSAPKPKGQTTVKVKALAVDKRAVTRTVRHTMGSKQKTELTGSVSPAVVTPTK
jgi:hypothetical protein